MRNIDVLDDRLSELKSLTVNISRGLRNLQHRKVAEDDPPATILIRSVCCRYLAHIRRTQPEVIAEQLYSGRTSDIHRALADPGIFLKRRSVTSPAMTTDPSWAGVLTAPAIYGAFVTLSPQSAYSQLARLGLRIDLTGHGSARLPRRASESGGGSIFVGEGRAIPVRKVDLSAAVLEPRGAKIISLFSNELSSLSVPSIETVLRAALSEDIALGIDTVLLSDSPASPDQPAGLLYSVAPLTASTATGAEAAVEDVAALAAAIQPAATDFALVMSSSRHLALMALLPGLSSVRIIESDVIGNRIVGLDASDFASGENDDLVVGVSDDAAISNDSGEIIPPWGQPSTISLYQHDLVGIKLTQQVGWCLRRSGRISWLEDPAW